jgi:hypothetical protein
VAKIDGNIGIHSLQEDVSVRATFRGVNWKNLVDWCYKTNKSNLSPRKLNRDDHEDIKVICAAHQIAAGSCSFHGPWEPCKKQLEALRVVAEELNEAWEE